jgi:hypothetical protein
VDLYDVLTAAAVIVAFPVFTILVTRVLAPDGWEVADLFRAPSELGWPPGIQEDEPVRWRVELLARDASTSFAGYAESCSGSDCYSPRAEPSGAGPDLRLTRAAGRG